MIILRLGVAGAVASLGALFSSQHLVFDLVSHFRIQYIYLILGLLFFAVFKQLYSIAGVLAMCLCVHVFDVYQSLKPSGSSATAQGTALRIMSSNLLASNDNYAGHIAYIESVNPDVIVFQEYTTDWDAALSVSLDDYPFRLSVPIDSPFGIAMYSKLPLADKEIVILQNNARPSVEAVVSSGSATLKIFGTHPPPPVSSYLYKERNRQLRQISERTSTHTGSVVVAGDLNVSPWSKHFRDFLAEGELFDGRRGHGLLPTWPTGFLPLQIPIDHIVVDGTVNVVSMNTSSGMSSDHRTLWANLVF